MKTLRYLTILGGLGILAFAIGFIVQLPLVISLWPCPTGGSRTCSSAPFWPLSAPPPFGSAGQANLARFPLARSMCLSSQ